MNELQSLFDTYKNTVYEKNLEGFLSIFDKELHVFDMWGQWSYQGLEAWREMAKGWFGSLGTERVVVDFDGVQSTVSDDMGVATAFVTFTGVSAEGRKLRSLQNRLTWVIRRKEGAWKVIHEHTSSPLDHATLKAILKR
jgi:uncharacterized protein (TIGR02246 family)